MIRNSSDCRDWWRLVRELGGSKVLSLLLCNLDRKDEALVAVLILVWSGSVFFLITGTDSLSLSLSKDGKVGGWLNTRC
jgi:hypothetical protein